MTLNLALSAGAIPAAVEPPRLFVLSDIGNEPDDQMSQVRLQIFSNEIEITGFAATTSSLQKDKVRPATGHHKHGALRSILAAVGALTEDQCRASHSGG